MLLSASLAIETSPLISKEFRPTTALPITTDERNNVTSTGDIGEVLLTGQDANGDEIIEIWLYVKWRTGGPRWSDQTWIQNYLQIYDKQWNRYMAMSCNTEYFRPVEPDSDPDEEEEPAETTKVLVLNYYGEESFKVKKDEDEEPEELFWHQIGSLAEREMEWWRQDEDNIIEGAYTSEFFEREAFQTCTAIAPLYATKNGEPLDDDVNKKYEQALEGSDVTFSTGFRVWDEALDVKYEDAADATETIYNLQNFGIGYRKVKEKKLATVKDRALTLTVALAVFTSSIVLF